MPELQKEKVEGTTVGVESQLHANTKQFTTIPNSLAEFSIYTYKSETEELDDIVRAGFFNTAYSFLSAGDMIRVFKLDDDKNITHYIEYIVLAVDKINKQVEVSTVTLVNLTKRKN